MDGFFASSFSFHPPAPVAPSVLQHELPFKQRIILERLSRHFNQWVDHLKANRELILIQCENNSERALFLQHVKFLLDREVHKDSWDFQYVICQFPTLAWYTKKEGKIMYTFDMTIFQDRTIANLDRSSPYSTLARKLKFSSVIVLDGSNKFGHNDIGSLDYYLRKVTGIDKAFADKTVILLGDVMEPSPRDDKPLFKCATTGAWTTLGHNPHDLYVQEFKTIYVLKSYYGAQLQNNPYRQFVHRLGCGSITTDDLDLLKARRVKYLEKDEVKSFEDVVRLFPSRKEVEEYTWQKITSMCEMSDITVIKNGADILNVFPKCPIILTKNVNKKAGLGVSLVGKIIDVERKPRRPLYGVLSADDVRYIVCEFPEYKGTNKMWCKGEQGVPIFDIRERKYNEDRVHVDYVKKFPLAAFFAITHCRFIIMDLKCKAAIKLGPYEAGDNTDFGLFAKFSSFQDFIILDDFISLERMNVNAPKESVRAGEIKRLNLMQPDLCKVNVASFLFSRQTGQRVQSMKLLPVVAMKETKAEHSPPWKKRRLSFKLF